MNQLPRVVLGFVASVLLVTARAPVAGESAALPSVPPATHALPAPGATPVPAIDCPDCGDGDPCTVDLCDTTTGFCRHEVASCDDGDPCTTDTCERYDPPFGCLHRPRAAGSTCSAPGPCMLAGTCVDGACQAAPAPEGSSCDAPSDCTEGDLCDGAGRCQPGRPLSPGTSCDDGDACTSGEVCGFDGTGATVCSGVARSCDDGNPCTDDACGVDDSCLHTPIACNDGNACTADACDTRTGACTHLAASEGQTCPGPDRCTASACAAGNCLASGAPGQICGDRGCERGVCNAISPILCTYQPDNSRCSQTGDCDSYFCDAVTHTCRGTGECHPGQCITGQCVTRGFCIVTGSTPGAPCDDGNVCTTNDVCGSGFPQCSGTTISCDDGNPCTVDSCDPVTGCRHDIAPSACDDHNPCTADACAADGATCLHAPIDGGACDDGNACTSGTVCVAGACAGGSSITCDDGNACTDDACDPAGGCHHATVVCPDDGNSCTLDRCDTGRGCVSVPITGGACDDDNNACTNDVCAAGVCAHVPLEDGHVCARYACTTGTCHAGACLLTDCDDHNDCTLDTCSAAGACSHSVDLDAACSDGNLCTAGDQCNAGPNGTAVCQGTPVPRPQTCGIGACVRTVDTCAGGIPTACVPGAPQPEVCNGVDDDCDGQVDENRIMATCTVKPLVLYDPPMRTNFSVVCRFRDRCARMASLPPSDIGPEAVYVVRADRTADMGDDVIAPDPLTLACPDPQQGSSYERGIVETTAARIVGDTAVTFDFSTPHDGACETLDGDRTAVLERLASTPDGLVTICVAGRYDGSPWQGCGFAILRHRPATLD